MDNKKFAFEKKKRVLKLIYESYVYYHDYDSFSLEDIIDKMRVYLDNKEFALLKRAFKEYKDYVISIFANSFYVNVLVEDDDVKHSKYKILFDNL